MTTWTPEYEKWRHGGWYVCNVRYPSGAIGCVSNNNVNNNKNFSKKVYVNYKNKATSASPSAGGI